MSEGFGGGYGEKDDGVSAAPNALPGPSDPSPTVSASGRVSTDAVKLSVNERKALLGMDAPVEMPVFNFRQIAARSGLERHLVRRTVRALARKGLADYYPASWNEDDGLLSAGYGLNDKGREMLRDR